MTCWKEFQEVGRIKNVVTTRARGVESDSEQFFQQLLKLDGSSTYIVAKEM